MLTGVDVRRGLVWFLDGNLVILVVRYNYNNIRSFWLRVVYVAGKLCGCMGYEEIVVIAGIVRFSI